MLPLRTARGVECNSYRDLLIFENSRDDLRKARKRLCVRYSLNENCISCGHDLSHE